MLEIEAKRFRLAENIMLRAVSGTGLFYAFNLENGDQFDLNETSYWLFEQIGQGTLFRDLLERFIVEFKLKREVAIADLVEAIDFAVANAILQEISE